MDDLVINNYRLIRQIGQGGMGIVYLAQHEVIERKVAIKLLRDEFIDDEPLVTRFFNEARAAAAAKHPGIVEILDVGYDQGQAFIMMELIEGKTLGKYLRDHERLGAIEAIDLTRQIASALSAAHSRSVVHRDLKPSNIMLVASDDPLRHITKVFDFGIAKLFGENSSHTRTGILMGTPTYMSPEQCKGAGRVDLRSDLYSLGCILYLMLTGQRVFKGEGEGEIIAKHIYEQPVPPAELAAVPAPLNAIVLQLLAKEPGDRHQTTQALIDALDNAVAALSLGQRSPTSVTAATTRLPLPPPEPLTPTPRARQIGIDAMQPDPDTGSGTPLATQGRTIFPEPTGITKRRSVTAVLALLVAVAGLSLVLYLRSTGPKAAGAPASEGAKATSDPSFAESSETDIKPALPATVVELEDDTTTGTELTNDPSDAMDPASGTVGVVKSDPMARDKDTETEGKGADGKYTDPDAEGEDTGPSARGTDTDPDAEGTPASQDTEASELGKSATATTSGKANQTGKDSNSAKLAKDSKNTKTAKDSKNTKTFRDGKERKDDKAGDTGSDDTKPKGPRTLNPFE